MRIKEGLSQRRLGNVLNVSIQQIQKYEKATNRISAASLSILAKFFKTPIEEFYANTSLSINDTTLPIEWCSNMDKKISENLKELRKTHKMHRKELAIKLNVSPEQVIRYETTHDEIPGSIIYKLSKIFETPIAELYKNIS